MKKAVKIIIAILLVAVISAGGFAFYKISQGISYDISSVEKIQNNVQIVKEDTDSVTVKKKDGSDFKVMMFTDTHLNGKKQEDIMTVSYIVENATKEKPDLIIFGGDNISSAFSTKRTVEFCELMENLGIYWVAVLGNHDGEGIFTYSREKIIETYSSYDYCLVKPGPEDIDGNGNCTVNILNSDNSIKEVLFFMDSGNYASEKDKAQYSLTSDSDYDGVKPSQVQWYKDKHDTLESEFGKFKSVTVVHIPPYQTEREYSEKDFLYGNKNEGVCESGFDSGLVDAMIEKGSTQAVYFGHDHVNDFGVMYEDILFSYIQSSGYGSYNMGTRGNPENEWLQGCTLLNIKEDGNYTAERILNHQ